MTKHVRQDIRCCTCSKCSLLVWLVGSQPGARIIDSLSILKVHLTTANNLQCSADYSYRLRLTEAILCSTVEQIHRHISLELAVLEQYLLYGGHALLNDEGRTACYCSKKSGDNAGEVIEIPRAELEFVDCLES